MYTCKYQDGPPDSWDIAAHVQVLVVVDFLAIIRIKLLCRKVDLGMVTCQGTFELLRTLYLVQIGTCWRPVAPFQQSFVVIRCATLVGTVSQQGLLSRSGQRWESIKNRRTWIGMGPPLVFF